MRFPPILGVIDSALCLLLGAFAGVPDANTITVTACGEGQLRADATAGSYTFGIARYSARRPRGDQPDAARSPYKAQALTRRAIVSSR
jgi:hypothetical protein